VPEVGTWEIDRSHQSFEFVARHLMHKGTTRPVTVDNAALETGGFLLARNVRLEIEAELVKK